MNTQDSDDEVNRKDFRRKKLRSKNLHKDLGSGDPEMRVPKQSDSKRIKEELMEEEWEDWDRFYNR
jgi:hypothetical protein